MVRKILLSVMALILLGAPAAFAAIGFDSSGVVSYQQTTNSPCVIGNPSCSNGGFGYTSAPTAPDFNQITGATTPGQYDLFSPTPVWTGMLTGNIKVDPKGFEGPYTVDNGSTGVQAPDKIPTTFTVGIDVNYNNIREKLVGFNTWVYDGSGPLDLASNWAIDAANSWGLNGSPFHAAEILEIHNGNGFSDAILTGFSLTNGSRVYFEAIYGSPAGTPGSDEDGMEQFFIIPAGTPTVPEPSMLLLLGAGLVGLGVAARRRVKK
jgi:hypothetical protein